MIKRSLRSALVPSIALAVAAVGVSARATAEPEFDVSVEGSKVVVVPKGEWHINTSYPWKLVVGDKKLGKGEFSLSETKATVAAPKGKATLKGGVCSGGQCKMFTKDVDIH